MWERELSLVKVIWILYLKIFVQDLCSFHAAIAGFSNYVALASRALIQRSSLYQNRSLLLPVSCFLRGDEVPRPVFWAKSDVVYSPFALADQHPALLTLFWVPESWLFCITYASLPSADEWVGGKWGQSMYFPHPPGSGWQSHGSYRQTLFHLKGSCRLHLFAPPGERWQPLLAVGVPQTPPSLIGAIPSPQFHIQSLL